MGVKYSKNVIITIPLQIDHVILRMRIGQCYNSIDTSGQTMDSDTITQERIVLGRSKLVER